MKIKIEIPKCRNIGDFNVFVGGLTGVTEYGNEYSPVYTLPSRILDLLIKEAEKYDKDSFDSKYVYKIFIRQKFLTKKQKKLLKKSKHYV